MNSTLSLLVSVATFVVVFTVLAVWAYNHWLGIGDPAVNPNPKQKENNMFAIVMVVLLLAIGGCAFTYIVTNGHDVMSSLKKNDVPALNSVPVPPTPHESAVQKQLEQEMRDVHARQMALSVAQEAALKADRKHIAKQREQELKAEKLNSRIASFERFTKIGEGQLKLLEQISKQKPPMVTNHVVFHAPPPTNIVNVTATSAPPNITFVGTNNITNVNNVTVSNNQPITVQSPTVTVQPVPVTLTLTSTATVSSGSATQAVVAPKPTPAPAVTNTPPAPKAPAKVKAQKAPAVPVVATTNATPAKASVAKAPPAKAGRRVVIHTEDPVKISRGAKDWWVVNLFTGTPETIQRKFTLGFDEVKPGDRSVAQAALDGFCSHQAKELRKKAAPDNLQGMFEEFIRKNPNHLSTGEKPPRKIGEILNMQPKITSEILPAGTPGT